jgi:hypothetical protein
MPCDCSLGLALASNAHAYRLYVVKELRSALRLILRRRPVISEDSDSGMFSESLSSGRVFLLAA